jgi:hypothetical protein
MNEELIENIRSIIKGFVYDELKGDYKDIVEHKGLWRFDISRQIDGSICTIFEYVYDEDPWGDYRTQVSFQGSLCWDPKGILQAKSMRLANVEYRADGPRRFSRKRQKSKLEEEKMLLEWEDSLSIGDLVDACFRVKGGTRRYISEIIKISPKSFLVKPKEVYRKCDVCGEFDEYEEKSNRIPRRATSRVTLNHGVFPLNINVRTQKRRVNLTHYNLTI